MLDDHELWTLFEKAEKEGFINKLKPVFNCDQECEDCPALKACHQLSDIGGVQGDYDTFLVRFKELYDCWS